MLDFCDSNNYELNEMDFGLLDHWNVDGTGESQAAVQAATPQTDDSAVDMTQMRQKLVKYWTESPWRFIPDHRDNCFSEHGNLPLPTRETSSVQFRESQKRLDRVIQEKLDLSNRDQVLGLVLGTIRNNHMGAKVASSFPAVDIMDTLVHIFLAAHMCSVSGWIHFGSFALNGQWPEWLGNAIAAGASLTAVPTLRKFGSAMQEAIRKSSVSIPSVGSILIAHRLGAFQEGKG